MRGFQGRGAPVSGGGLGVGWRGSVLSEPIQVRNLHAGKCRHASGGSPFLVSSGLPLRPEASEARRKDVAELGLRAGVPLSLVSQLPPSGVSLALGTPTLPRLVREPRRLGVLRGGRGGGEYALQDVLGPQMRDRGAPDAAHEGAQGDEQAGPDRVLQRELEELDQEAQDVEAKVHYLPAVFGDLLCRGELTGTRGRIPAGTKKAGGATPAGCVIRLSRAPRAGGIRLLASRRKGLLTKEGRPEGATRKTRLSDHYRRAPQTGGVMLIARLTRTTPGAAKRGLRGRYGVGG